MHEVVELRTAEDVVAGRETRPEPVWVSDVHTSDAVLPAIAPAGTIHR